MTAHDRSRRRGLVWFGAGVLGVACVGSPAAAIASCPRLGSGASPGPTLITFQHELARLGARERPPSDAQMWEAFTNGTITMPPLILNPPNGPAPLAVRARWFWHPVENPRSVEFDADGDGRPEISGSTYGQVDYTYQVPGRFTARATVHDHQGRSRTHTMVVTVVPFADFDADIQARWKTLKAALSAADVNAAVECLHSRSRSRYREVFKDLFATAAPDVDDVLTSITFVDQQPGRSVYQMIRTRDGKRLSFQVLFLIDDDGVWRLYSF